MEPIKTTAIGLVLLTVVAGLLLMYSLSKKNKRSVATPHRNVIANMASTYYMDQPREFETIIRQYEISFDKIACQFFFSGHTGNRFMFQQIE